jgi:dTDP-4-dehydrorhamnose reductase
MLGRALLRQWKKDRVTGVGSARADIRLPEQVEQVVGESEPDWIVLSAAYTDVDGCETNPALAAAVNTEGALNVARASAKARARLLFMSTDYVFDGKKSTAYETADRRNPINVYGRTKADAETRILEVLPDACIVRTSWLFGPWGKCFPDTILKLAGSRPELDVVDDQRGCPTYSFDLAEAIIKLCRGEAKGIIHCTNRGVCSWYEFAREIIRQAGAKTRVLPTTSERFVRPAARPRYSVLSPASLNAYGVTMRSWNDTLPDYLRERGS